MAKKNRKAKIEAAAVDIDGIVQHLKVAAVTETPIEVIEDVIETLAAIEGEVIVAAAHVVETLDQPIGATFDEVLASISDEDVDTKLAATVAAITERKSFESVKDPGNGKIQKYLDNVVSKQLATKRASRLMCAVNFDPMTFNRVIHEGNRYNVYAIGKFADAVYGLTDGVVKNAINIACMKSLFRFRANGTVFNGEMAKAAASDKIRVEHALRDILVRHTVSASTAPTQASSTMQALESLGIVARTGSGKNPIFNLTSNPIVAKLEKVLAAA